MMTRRLRPTLPALAAALLLGSALWPIGGAGSGLATGVQAQGMNTSADWRGRLMPLLPQNAEQAQVMEARPRISVAEVRRRVQNVGGDLRVLDQVALAVQRGGLPLYDQRLKISEADFRRYLVIQQELQPSGRTVKLGMSQIGNRMIFGDLGGTALLRGIAVDLGSGEMYFPEGFSAKPEPWLITPSQAGDDPLGARSGYIWKVRGSNPTTQTALSGHFALLVIPDGSVLISYDRTGIINGTVSGTNRLILKFCPGPLPVCRPS